MLSIELAYLLAGLSVVLFPGLLWYTAWRMQREAEKLYETEKCRATETISMAEWRRRYMDQ